MYVLYYALIVLHVPLLLEGNTHLSSAIIQSTYRILGIFCEVYISQIGITIKFHHFYFSDSIQIHFKLIVLVIYNFDIELVQRIWKPWGMF